MTPSGPAAALLPPATLSTGEAAMGDVPAVGADTQAVLKGLGYSAERIADLRAAGVV